MSSFTRNSNTELQDDSSTDWSELGEEREGARAGEKEEVGGRERTEERSEIG